MKEDDRLFIPVLLGTVRKGRKSEAAAKFIVETIEQRDDMRTELVDPRELNLPGDGNNKGANDPRYSDITARADGFVIVTPEYNHGYPGSLKRMLDSELKNYIHKPTALVGVSSGRWGGVRAIEALVPVLRELGLAVTFNDVMVTDSYHAFDENDQPVNDALRSSLDKSLAELKWFAQTMKWGRENQESEK
jgi:NAD(P)H-dependent FMN reductase